MAKLTAVTSTEVMMLNTKACDMGGVELVVDRVDEERLVLRDRQHVTFGPPRWAGTSLGWKLSTTM